MPNIISIRLDCKLHCTLFCGKRLR